MASEDHGIEGACYSNGADGYLPMMDCLCGFGTSYGNTTWANAGAEFDAHLLAVGATVAAVDPIEDSNTGKLTTRDSNSFGD